MKLGGLGPLPRQAPPPGYKYHCDDLSLLKPVYYRLFVMPIAKRLRRQWSANTVTFLSQVFAFATVAVALLSLHLEVPSWVWAVVCPLGYLGYIVLDHVDGTHARRTNRSTAAGELVDHWCDAWNAMLLSFSWSVAWRVSPLVTMIWGSLTSLALAVAYEEHRRSGRMLLDKLGAGEAMTAMWISFVPLGIIGRDKLPGMLVGYGWTVSELFQAVCVLGSGVTVLTIVSRAGLAVLRAVWPLVAFSVVLTLWVYRGQDLGVASFALAAFTATVAGRIVLQRTTGIEGGPDWISLGLAVVGLILHFAGAGPVLERVAGFALATVAIVRAGLDFSFGLRACRHELRAGEFLDWIVARADRTARGTSRAG